MVRRRSGVRFPSPAQCLDDAGFPGEPVPFLEAGTTATAREAVPPIPIDPPMACEELMVRPRWEHVVIPIRDINPTSRTAWLTIAIIAANVAVFVLWEPTFAGQTQQQEFFFCNAQIPYELTDQTTLAEGGEEARRAIAETFGTGESQAAALQGFLQQTCPDKSWLASVFVSMFLHGGWLHLAGNMLFLWIFGNNVEDRLGRVTFVAVYVLGGLAATALQVALSPSSAVPNVGASGAIAAILGAYLVLFPRARIHTLVIFFFITFLELPASFVLLAWFVLQLFSGVGELGRQVGGGVAYGAHVGGFVFGMAVAWLFFRSRGRRPPYEFPPPPSPYPY
jgi:membrane associated rhomboid family serine protease